MTNQILPIKIDPLFLANKGASLQGTLNLQQLPRICDQLCESNGEVAVTLHFGKDHKNFYYIKGTITAELSLPCQRCLEPVIYKINSEFCLSPVKDDKAAAGLPSHYEPLILVDKTLIIADMIEDEIILNLPMVAKHDTMCAL